MFKYNSTFSSFSVNDITKAKQFYGETLGLELKETPQGLDLQLSGGNTVFIYPKSSHAAATFTVLNFIVDDIENEVDQLTKAGVKFEVYDTPEMKTNEKGITQNAGIENSGPVVAWFKDPAGNFLSVMQIQ